MLVSHFELLVKRTASVSAPPNITAPFRRVVQGYFLTITNLGLVSKNLKLRFKITANTGNRTLTSLNTQCIYDNTNNLNLTLTSLPSIPAGTQRWDTQFFNLGANQTALIVVVPNFNNFLGNINPDMEIRGYVELFQQTSGLAWPISSVQVLLTAETRGTFLDNDYPSSNPANELDFDQIAYTLPLASGKAENLVPGIILPNFLNVSNIQEIQSKISEENPQLDAKEIDVFSKAIVKMMDAVQK